MMRLVRLACLAGFLASSGAALAADEDYLGGFEGRWEGSLKSITPESYDAQHGSPGGEMQLAITAKNQAVSVFTKTPTEWREVKPGRFQMLAFKTNAAVTAIDSSNDGPDQDGWVETWNLTLTHKDRDNLLVSMTRSVNNYGQPGDARAGNVSGRFFTLYFGTITKVAGQ